LRTKYSQQFHNQFLVNPQPLFLKLEKFHVENLKEKISVEHQLVKAVLDSEK